MKLSVLCRPHSFQTGVRYWFALLAVFGIWLIVRPYFGIRHDSVLYAGQALAKLYPDAFSSDVFFAHGAQDAFTVFPSLMSKVFSWQGIGTGSVVVLLFCLLLLWLGIYALFSRFLGRAEMVAGFAALAVFPHLYGAQQLFGFSEPFLTARSGAEPLVVLSLAAYVSGSRIVSLLLLGAAFAFHPIIALGGVIVVWCLAIQENPKKILLIIPALAVVFLFAFAGVKPFDRLLMTFDAEWLQAISEGIVFLRNWDWVDWNVVFIDVTILVYCLRYADGCFRRLLIATLVGAMGGIVAALLLADGMKNLLLTQLQLWRGLWISHLFSLMLLPWLGRSLLREGKGLVLLALLAALVGEKHEAALPILALAIVIGRGQVIGELIQQKYRWAVWTVCLALILRASSSTFIALAKAAAPRLNNSVEFALIFVSMPILAVMLCGISLFLIGRARLLIGFLTALLIFSLGIVYWDRRSDWQIYIESAQDPAHPFKQKIAPNDQVYWEKGLEPTWFLLNRPSYYSENQGSGVVFNKGTAIEYAHRKKLFTDIQFAKDICLVASGLNNVDDECAPDKELIHDLCSEANDLSFVILKNNIGGWAELDWRFIGAGGVETVYYLHGCAFIRAQTI